MKTLKESPLAVSHFLPEIPFIKREAQIYADESGYLFVQYSGEAEIQERFNPEAFTELLKLIPPMEYIYDEAGKKRHGIYNIPEIDPHKVISYINRFGVVGISDSEFRSRVMYGRDVPSITRLTGLGIKEAKKLYKGKSLEPKFLERLNAIREGDEVPYRLIEKVLKDLAKCSRLYFNLLDDPVFEKKGVLNLTVKNRRRIVSAWNGFGGAFRDDQDPADPVFNLNEEWDYHYGKDRTIPPVDFAEGALSSFSSVLNHHLARVSHTVLLTPSLQNQDRENTGLETAFSMFLLHAFQNHRVKRVCRECGSVFLPERLKEENKYCGNTCRRKVVNRNYKAKKKVSASKAESKAIPKARKEKK